MRRDQVKTPALILDLDVLDANIATMVATAQKGRHCAYGRTRSRTNRPISPAGSSPPVRLAPVAQRSAKPRAMAAAGIPGLLVTSPLATADMQARLGALLLRGADLMVVADNPRNVAELADTGGARRRRCSTSWSNSMSASAAPAVSKSPDAIALARQIAGAPSLRFAGVQAYWGHIQQVMPFETREARVKEAGGAIESIDRRLE